MMGLTPAWLEYYEERAAIREFDGGQDRDAAELDAMKETLIAVEDANNAERKNRSRTGSRR